MAIFPPLSLFQKFVTALKVPYSPSVIKKGVHMSVSLCTVMMLSLPCARVTFTISVWIKVLKLLLISLSSLLNTPRKMHKSKLSQNFYTIGRNNELKEISSSFNDRIYFKETGSGNTFSIKRSNGWCFFYNLGADGSNGNSDILSFRCNYDGNKVVITKLTNMSGISCDATISDNIVHFTFGGQFINAIIITG